MRALRILYPLFLLSGFCGLIYESIWAGYLKLFLGHAAYAQAVVLVVFIGGMALGAWLCGRHAYRFRNPLIAYALAECLIGVAAIAFHRIFVASTDWAYASLLPNACGAEGLCYASWLFAALLILPQSILLGATFPLMAAGILRHAPARAGRVIATLYFVNSLGAVFGVLTATFLLVPTVGLPGASLTAGIANVLLAAIVYLYARSLPTLAGVAPAAIPTARAGQTSPKTLLVVALLTGLTSFVYEVVWIRMLSLVLGGSTHAFEIMLASFILGLALGGAWIGGRIERLRDPKRYLAHVQIAMGLLAIGTLVLYNEMYEVMSWLLNTLTRNDSGYLLFNVGSSLIAMTIMLPATIMAGMTLPLITHLLLRTRQGERSIGYVYAWNTFGGIVGVLLAVHFGLPHLGLKLSLGAAALVDVAIGMFLLAGALGIGGVSRRAVTVASLLAFCALFAWGNLDPQRIAASVYRTASAKLDAPVIFLADGKTATVTVFESLGSIRAIQTNGKADASIDMSGRFATTDEHTQTLLGLLPFAFDPGIRDAAVIGHGSGMTTTAVLTQPGVRTVDTIEIEPAMVVGARLFRPIVEAAFTDPRSHVIIDDARSYLARTKRRYDLIVSEPSNPWVAGVSSLFTREFYGRARRALNPGGTLMQWIHVYETNEEMLGSIVRAMGEEFDDLVAFRTAGDLLILARTDGRFGPMREDILTRDGSGKLLAHIGIRNLTDLQLRRFAGRQVLEGLFRVKAARPNSDYFPLVDTEAARARFRGDRAEVVFNLPLAPLPIAEIFEAREWSSNAWPSDVAMDVGLPYVAGKTANVFRALASTTDRVAMPSDIDPELVQPLAALRAVYVDCVPDDTARGLMDEVINIAGFVNIGLPPSLSAAVWDAVSHRPCGSVGQDRAQWLSLFRAISRRDLGRMAADSTALLDKAHSDKQRQFLVLVGYTALRAQGNVQGAEALRERLPRGAENLWIRWVARLTPGTSDQRATR